MHPHIGLTVANDRIADRVCFAERQRTARGACLRRRQVRFALRLSLRRSLAARPAVEATA